jgi:hypothetical protein
MLVKLFQKKLTTHFKSIDELINASHEDILHVDEIGEKIAASLIGYFGFAKNLELIERLKNHGLIFHENINLITGSSLEGLSFVVTGTFENFNRDKIKEIIVNNGGRVSSNISSKSLIIEGESPGPSKIKKAEKLGITTISIEKFISFYKIHKVYLHIINTVMIVQKISVHIYLLLCNHMVAYVVDKIHIGLPGFTVIGSGTSRFIRFIFICLFITQNSQSSSSARRSSTLASLVVTFQKLLSTNSSFKGSAS